MLKHLVFNNSFLYYSFSKQTNAITKDIADENKNNTANCPIKSETKGFSGSLWNSLVKPVDVK